jgi:hypothetical protein
MYDYQCKLTQGELELTEHSEKIWVKVEDLKKIDFAAADLDIVGMIKKDKNYKLC